MSCSQLVQWLPPGTIEFLSCLPAKIVSYRTAHSLVTDLTFQHTWEFCHKLLQHLEKEQCQSNGGGCLKVRVIVKLYGEIGEMLTTYCYDKTDDCWELQQKRELSGHRSSELIRLES